MSALASAQEAAKNSSTHTVTGLKRWSVGDRTPPSVDKIKNIHVYDFDNTLFASPLPNKQVWNGSTLGLLQSQEVFQNGGWWHDETLLASTGKGLVEEEPRAWEGWWNEQIVELVQLTMQQADAVCVLLTGRAEDNFQELIKRMVNSKGLEFDLICLKPEVGPSNQRFSSTMNFKQAFLADLVRTYREADEIRIYEDRPRHVTGFRSFLSELNQGLLADRSLNARKPIKAEVVEVSEDDTKLDPTLEITEIQRMIDTHNAAHARGELSSKAKKWKIKRGLVMYTGHLLTPADTDKLLAVANLPTSKEKDDKGIRILANNIMITPGPAPPPQLKRAGGLGNKIRWRVVALGHVNNPELWAAQVTPANPADKPFTRNTPPAIVLGLRGNGARPTDVSMINRWNPLPTNQQFEFETTIGEKVLLSIEAEGGSGYQNRGSNINNNSQGYKRPYESMDIDQDFPPLGQQKQNTHVQSGNGASAAQGQWPPRGPSGPDPKRPAYQNGGTSRPQGQHQSAFSARNGNNGPPRGPRGGAGPGRGGGGGGGRGGGRGPQRKYHPDDAATRGAGNGAGGGGRTARQYDDLTY